MDSAEVSDGKASARSEPISRRRGFQGGLVQSTHKISACSILDVKSMSWVAYFISCVVHQFHSCASHSCTHFTAAFFAWHCCVQRRVRTGALDATRPELSKRVPGKYFRIHGLMQGHT
jgi:hypothetical protein